MEFKFVLHQQVFICFGRLSINPHEFIKCKLISAGCVESLSRKSSWNEDQQWLLWFTTARVSKFLLHKGQNVFTLFNIGTNAPPSLSLAKQDILTDGCFSVPLDEWYHMPPIATVKIITITSACSRVPFVCSSVFAHQVCQQLECNIRACGRTCVYERTSSSARTFCFVSETRWSSEKVETAAIWNLVRNLWSAKMFRPEGKHCQLSLVSHLLPNGDWRSDRARGTASRRFSSRHTQDLAISRKSTILNFSFGCD